MGKLKAILKTIFCLPPFWTVLISFLGYAAVIAVAVSGVQDPVLQYASYTASAYALAITVTGLVRAHRAVGGVRKYIDGHPFMKRFRSTAVGEKYLTDIRFRAGVSLYQGFLVNLLYIAMKLAVGLWYRSVWFISLAAYYALLAVMRFLLARRLNAREEAAELRRYRLCGFMLLFMNQALTGVVILMIRQNRGFYYPGVLIYAMAAYAFYAVIIAVVNLVKTRQYKSPVLSAAKVISLVAALVSILSLETAMMARFGGDEDPMFRRIMIGATGGGICAVVTGMAVCMIWRANKKLKN